MYSINNIVFLPTLLQNSKDSNFQVARQIVEQKRALPCSSISTTQACQHFFLSSRRKSVRLHKYRLSGFVHILNFSTFYVALSSCTRTLLHFLTTFFSNRLHTSETRFTSKTHCFAERIRKKKKKKRKNTQHIFLLLLTYFTCPTT